ncbi:MAG TPA: LLM class F420-dependent oxidoreductase [Acidimicrobiaceae bacterium]|nr:LLM class F420-dependent oxidoreductase [Acidimicrobiaceae bacterium]
MTNRYGMTVPFGGPLFAQADRFRELVDLGYTDVWTAEADGHDGLTPLALASIWAPELRLGTAILPAFTRGPALLAQSAAAMATAAPGRFVLGLGTSSNVIVEHWNGIDFEAPYGRVRDTVRFLSEAFTGEKVTSRFESFDVRGFRLTVVPEEPPPIVVAALRPGMLRLAGRESDGAVVNWLSTADAERVTAIVREAAAEAGRSEPEVVARIFVCPSPDREAVVAQAKRLVAAYVNVPVYRAFHEWLGRTELFAEHWERWDAGDRSGSLEVMPEVVVDDLLVHGTADECRAHIDRYVEAGITTPVLSIVPLAGLDADAAVRDLAPGSWTAS